MKYLVVLTVLSVLALGACKSTKTTDEAAKTKAAPTVATLPGIAYSIDEKYVDVAGEVCLNEGLLELIATSGGKKAHESIVNVEASPANIHFAMVLIGAKNGKPGSWKTVDGKVMSQAATGDKVHVSVIVDGKEVPIHEWVSTDDGKARMTNSVFLFSGSEFSRDEATSRSKYSANDSGNLISLVSFSDETFALPQPASHANDDLIWIANKETVPAVGTKVAIRLRLVK